MPKFSTFSIYENEMRQFIELLSENSTLDRDELTNWLYDAGVNEFRKAQGIDYYPYVEECKKRFLHRPLISIQHSEGQHYEGLMAVREALIKAFSGDNPYLPEVISAKFDLLLLPTIRDHKAFIKLESDVSSEFNDYLDKHGDQSPVDSLKKVIQLFEARQGQHPDLQEDFKNKLTLMKEFLAELLKSCTPKSDANNQFFKPEEPNQPAPTQASSSSLGNTGNQ